MTSPVFLNYIIYKMSAFYYNLPLSFAVDETPFIIFLAFMGYHYAYSGVLSVDTDLCNCVAVVAVSACLV
jgi:hypothetical protein